MSSTVIPCLRYRDAHKAIDWLCGVFGFQKQAVYEGEQGSIAHAQLTLEGGMIMIGSADADSAWGKMIRQPSELQGFETQAPYIFTHDPDGVYERAQKAGAEIVIQIKDEDYGGRGFTCRDIEGRLWSVGSYDPWKSG